MRLDRLNMMEQYILGKEVVSLQELAAQFLISTNTVRRDLNALLERGRIKKVYGGVSVCQDTEVPPIAVRDVRNHSEKKQIGELASTLVLNKSTIFLDSGSTTPHMLSHLADKEGVTVVSHSLSVLYEASKYPSLNIIALGGMYNRNTSSYTGLSTVEQFSMLTVSTIFLAASGVSLVYGLSNSTYSEAELKRNVSQRSLSVVLLADHTKFDHDAVMTFYRFEDLSGLVTDRLPSAPYLEVIKKNKIKLLCPETMGNE